MTSITDNLIAGGTAGITELCIMYPLDTAKTRMQGASGKTNNMFVILKDLILKEKFSMYRGLPLPLLTETPKRALKFMNNAFFSKKLKAFDPKSEYLTAQTIATLSGLGAGIIEGAFVSIPELVKVRMQVPENKGLYRNSFQCGGDILKKEGPMRLFTGMNASILRNASWNSGYFGSIYFIKQKLEKVESLKKTKKIKDFFAGAVSGTIGTILNTPFDTVKTRLQLLSAREILAANDSVKTAELAKIPRSTIGMAGHIAKNEGLTALYKGFAPKVLRLSTGGGIMLLVYEAVIEKLKKRRSGGAL